MTFAKNTKKAIAIAIAISVATIAAPAFSESGHHFNGHNGMQRVLLISIDGMHALDFENCGTGGYCPNLASLGSHGVTYTRTTTSRPSDSFPGLMALVTGASPFNAPGLPPNGDPRTPDIIVQPNVGVVYTGSSKKQAEHGGFAQDDTNVMLLVSNPSIQGSTVTSFVETAQVAPTILQALGLNPNQLQGVQKEGTPVLPGLNLGSGNQDDQGQDQ